MPAFETEAASWRFARSSNCVTRTIGGETLIVPVRASVADLVAIYVLDEVGAFVWNRLDGLTPLGATADAICAEYEVDRQQAVDEAIEFIATLESAGLVIRSESAEATR